jgi:hypothetical protein
MLKRLGVLACASLGLTLISGALEAGASGGSTVLQFQDATSNFSGVGFDANNPNAIPPVGASIVITIRLKNGAAQFGKPTGAIVGRVLLQCTVLAVNSPQDIDGVCSGIGHVPNGFFTFGGNGGFSNTPVDYYAITGGVGAYANDRGEIKVVNQANGGSHATVMLQS